MTLSAEQLADMQGDLGITNDQKVFTDAELQRFYVRAGDNYNLAMALAIRRLLMNNAKLYKYTVGQTTVNKDQVFDHLKDLYAEYRAAADEGGQVRIFGRHTIPPHFVAKPTERVGVLRERSNVWLDQTLTVDDEEV